MGNEEKLLNVCMSFKKLRDDGVYHVSPGRDSARSRAARDVSADSAVLQNSYAAFVLFYVHSMITPDQYRRIPHGFIKKCCLHEPYQIRSTVYSNIRILVCM